jgi:ABC-type sulfate transport system permease component
MHTIYQSFNISLFYITFNYVFFLFLALILAIAIVMSFCKLLKKKEEYTEFIKNSSIIKSLKVSIVTSSFVLTFVVIYALILYFCN